VRKSFTVRDPKYKDKDTYADVYSEYRLVQGVQTPFVLTRMKDDEMISQRFLTKVTYNQGLQDDFFIPPTSLGKKK
jgi:predicted alpha/beta-fold hydrolase